MCKTACIRMCITAWPLPPLQLLTQAEYSICKTSQLQVVGILGGGALVVT